MKLSFLLHLAIFINLDLYSQTEVKESSFFKVEWSHEISKVEDDRVSGLLMDSDHIVASTRGDKIVCFNALGIELWNSNGSSGVYTVGKYGDHIFTQGYMHLEKRSNNGEILNKTVLINEDNNTISARNGQIWRSSLYTTNMSNLLLKYDLNGNRIFTKVISENCDNIFLSVGEKYVYVLANIKEPFEGLRLLQFDTLGNRNWAVGTELPVYGMYIMYP